MRIADATLPQLTAPAAVRGGKKKPPAPVEIHDRQQLELRFSYDLGGSSPSEKTTVDTYLFVPKNVGINRINYTKEMFYGDVTALVRLDAEPLSLDLLSDSHCPQSPLHGFAEGLRQFRECPRPPASQPIVIHVKLYAHLFARAVRGELKKLVKRLSRIEDQATADRYLLKLSEALDEVRFALRAFRRLRSAYWPYEQLAHQSLSDAMRNADEYMSLFLEERLAVFLQNLERRSDLPLPPGFLLRCRLQCGQLAAEEAAHRRRFGYLAYTEDQGPSGDYFTYRASMLKKVVQQALYLDPRAVERDRFLRNAAGGVGAALAAIWAAAAQLPEQLSKVSGSLKLLVFASAVGAYVMKDRIKVLTNEFLSRRLRRFDHVNHLTAAAFAVTGLRMPRVEIRESMGFVAPAGLSPEIRELRQHIRTLRSADIAMEEIIHHRKVVQIGEPDEAHRLPAGYRVLDILRLNVRHFLVRLDEPVDQVAYYDWRRQEFALARLPKVYHLNLIVKIRRELQSGYVEESFERLRVVLNKEGIVRAEVVSSSAPTPKAGPPDSAVSNQSVA